MQGGRVTGTLHNTAYDMLRGDWLLVTQCAARRLRVHALCAWVTVCAGGQAADPTDPHIGCSTKDAHTYESDRL